MDSSIKYPFKLRAFFILYGILCVMLFIFMLFPYYALKPKIENLLSRATGMEVSVAAIKPSLPFGWTLRGLKVSGNSSLESLTLKPRILPLLTGKIALGIKIMEGKGYLKGSLGTSYFKIGNDVDVDLKMKDFELSVIRVLSKKLDEISGVVSGEIDFSYRKKNPDKSDGEINLIVNDGQIPLNIPSFPIAAIPFSKLEIDAKMDRGLLKINKADLSGNDVSGSVRGDLKMAGRPEASNINFVANLKLSQAYSGFTGPSGSGNIKIIIGGTIASPRTMVE